MGNEENAGYHNVFYLVFNLDKYKTVLYSNLRNVSKYYEMQQKSVCNSFRSSHLVNKTTNSVTFCNILVHSK